MSSIPVTDIHTMDGKLNCTIKSRYSIEEKRKIISLIIKTIEINGDMKYKQEGLRGLKIILEGIGLIDNYNAADKIYADDVLCEIHDVLLHKHDPELIETVFNLICEQMNDMIITSGYCGVGRATRLYQIYLFLKDLEDLNFSKINI